MLKKFHLDKLSIQMLIFISVLIFASVALTAVLSIRSMYDVVGSIKQSEVQSSLSLLSHEISDMADSSKKTSVVIASDGQLVSAVLYGDAAAVTQRASAFSSALQNACVTVTDRYGAVLVRLQGADASGDSLADQADIKAALVGEPFSGVLSDKTLGLSVVSAAPVTDNSGAVIGTVSVAFPLTDTTFLDQLKTVSNNDYTIFSGDVRINTTIMQNGKRVIGTKLSAAVTDVVITNKRSYIGKAAILGENYVTAYQPIFAADGSTVLGVLFSGAKVTDIEQSYASNLRSIILGALALVIVFDVIAFFLVDRKIKRPLCTVVQAAQAIETGSIDPAVTVSLASVRSQNEIGSLARSMEKAVGSIERIARDTASLEAVVDTNNLCIRVDATAHQGIYKKIMEIVSKLVMQLHGTVSNISAIAEQVSAGAQHLSDGSQALSRGATEQSGAIDELFESVTNVADKAYRNAENGGRATEYMNEAASSVSESNSFMKQLLQAMGAINTSSEKISSIIKIIDDISFQTNILALNAAVEAARAGAAGKGFSVVADEVRMLASRSADAAKQTDELISNTINTIRQGTKLANATADTLNTVEEKATLAQEMNADITAASNEQASAILEIKQRLNAISSVVQNNTATAEESASISEELYAQSASLYNEIKKYKI
ncbi:cache domain-containing protein [Oscillospiraceae bacterium CM]|nr:cache domain-containing protein [Oscillospiraceae bacterium CM]